jgi:PAS domain S-box-containing protein
MAPEKDDMDFTELPQFARFILDNYADDYVAKEVSVSRSMDIPLWRQFENIPDEQIISQSKPYYLEFLMAVAERRIWQHLRNAIEQYRQDMLMHVAREQITPQDLLMTHAARKTAMLFFLPSYTAEISLFQKIVYELDALFLKFSVVSSEAYTELLHQKMAEEKSIKDKLFSTSPGFYYLYDIASDSQILPSEKLFTVLGYSRYDFAGNPRFFRQIMHPEDLPGADNYLQSLESMKEGDVKSFNYRLRNSAGEYRWMKNYETVYKVDDAGKPIQLLGVAFDVTQEKIYTEEIQAKEEALIEAQNLANIGSFTWDLEANKLVHASRPLQGLGLTEGDSFEDIMSNVHPGDKEQVLKSFQKAIAGKREYECEYRCGIKDRERILWSKGKVLFTDGRARQFKATIMDVTDKHHMIRKLQRSEELYKQAQALNKIGNWSWNFNSDRIQWSDELFRIYGLAPQSEKITFERYCSFVHPGDRQSRKELIEDQLKNPGHREYYFRIISADREEKILYGQSEVLINEEGVPYKMIGTCQDVTVQKTLEQTLYDRTIQLQKSNASLKVFAYISSHDLKEPLRKISLFGDRLRMLNANKLDEQSTGILTTIIQSSLRLQQMIDEILSVSRINSEDNFEDASLQEILEEVLLSLETQVEEKSAIITYDPLPTVYVNAVQIRQLFMNLISNSLKFSRPNVAPVINITCDFPSVREITDMGLQNSRRFVRISFADNGIGFQNDYSEKIFAIFQRLHDKSAYKGTGIGLAICREIVGHHGGIITATGTLHQGSIFSVVLPVQSS